MKRVLILLSLVLIIVASLLATTLFKPISYEISPQLAKFLEDNGLEIKERLEENLYLTTNGSYVQGFPMISDSTSENTVDAAVFEYDATSDDGHVSETDTTYSATHDAASGTVDDAGGSIRVGQTKPTASSYSIWRGALFFDTSAIPDNSIISYASLMLEVGGDYSERDFYICAVSGDGLGSSLTATDYAILGTADATVSNGCLNTNSSDHITVGEFTSLPLNAGGINDISLNGTSAFGLRSFNDITETAPNGSMLEIIYPESDISTNPENEPRPSYYDNWECVDDYSPNSDTDYIKTARWWNTWAADRYSMTNVSAEAYASSAPIGVTANLWIAVHKYGTAYNRGCACPGLRYNGSNYMATVSGHANCGYPGLGCWGGTLSFSYVQRSYTWTTNPQTSNQWTWDEVNDLQGYLMVHAYGQNYEATRTTSYNLAIEYIPSNSGAEYVDFSASEMGAGHIPLLYVVYTVGNAPTAPTDLLVNDEEHPITTDMTPYFSAVGHHSDAGATMNWYSIQVDDQQSFTSPLWSSGQVAFTTNISDGERCENIEYVGLPFTIDTRYYWRIAFYDQDEDISPWSSTSWFDFDVPSTCPDNLVAEPISHNEIKLTWDNADSDFTYGALYFKTISYPGARSDGTRLYLGPGSAYTHKGLDAGTNYYYRVWGYDSASGNYSTGTCYSSDWATTLAGETDGPTPPLVPPEWSQYPTCEVYEGVPFIHDLITDAYATNGSTTHYDVPDETACLLCTFGFLLMFGLTGYFVTRRNELVLVGILCVGIIAASIAGAMPMWFIVFAFVGSIYLFVKVRA